MAKIVLTDAYVSVNSVDLSDHVQQVEVTFNADTEEGTAMGDAGHNFMPGLKDQGVSVTFFQDFASSKVDATLSALVGAAAFPIEVRAVNTTVSAVNPKYAGNVLLASYNPISGQVGGAHVIQANFVPGDGTGIARGTS